MTAKRDVVPFPRTRDWASGLPADRWAAFADYHYAISYHLNMAVELMDRAQRIVYKPQWAPPDFESRSARLLSWDVDEAAFLGGVAVLEAGAALESELQLVNHVLGLGVPKDRVRWNRNPKADGLHRRLVELTDAKAPGLITALRQVYNSIGYDMLGRYRNWSLHRGALRVTYEVDLGKPVPFPIEPPPDSDPGHRDFLLQGSLWQRLANSTVVTSSTFVPPAQARYRGTAQPATEDFTSGPLRIDRGARDVILGEFTVASGDLFEDAETYRARNPVPLDDGRVKVADEELGKYTPLTFIMAVLQVVQFAKTAATEVVDAPLVELLRLRT